MFNVIIIDDSTGFRMMLKARLEESPMIKVIAEASDSNEGIQIAAANVWDLAIVDVNLPTSNGFKVTKSILKPDRKVIITSSANEPDYPRLARDAGANTFIEKRRLTTKLVLGILEGKNGS